MCFPGGPCGRVIMEMDSGACGLPGPALPLLPPASPRLGLHRTADRQPARPLQGVRTVLTLSL